MFQTTSIAKHPIMSAIAGENEDVWTFVTLALSAPWYFVTYEEKIEGERHLADVMLSSSKQVADLLSQQSRVLKVTDLLLASPAKLNKTSGWCMEKLEEVLTGTDPQRVFRYTVYKLANGKTYLDNPLVKESDAIANMKSVFRF